MAFSHGSKAKIYLNGNDVSGFVRSITASSELDTASVDVMGGTFKQSVTGLLGATLSVQGYVDGASDGSDELFGPAGAFQTSSKANLIYMPQGNTGGGRGYGYSAWDSQYEVTTDIGDAGTFSSQFQSDVGLQGGLLVHPYGAEGSPGSSPSAATGYLYDTQTTAGGWAYLVTNAAAGLTVTLTSSISTNGSYTQFASFQTTSTKGSEYLPIAPATINQYIRCTWTGSGTFAVLFGRK